MALVLIAVVVGCVVTGFVLFVAVWWLMLACEMAAEPRAQERGGRDIREQVVSATFGKIELSTYCWCAPPKLLAAGVENQTVRCEDCGFEVLVGLYAEGPRLKLVEEANT